MDKKLEEMKKIIKQRVRVQGISVGIIIIIIICVIMNVFHPFIGGENYSDFMAGFQVGILVALDIVMLFHILKYRAALKNEKKLKLLYLEETDERVKYIQQMAGKSSYKYVEFILLVAACIAGYFSIVAFVALLGAALVEAVVTGILSLYYTKKMTGNEF
jgi:hypothetical protein